MFHKTLQLTSARIKALNCAGIYTDQDLINFAPRRYLDRQSTLPISSVTGNGMEITVIGIIEDVSFIQYGNKRLEIIITDDSGSLKCVWFKGIGYFSKTFKPGDLVSVFGKAKQYGQWLSMAHPDVDKLNKPQQSLKTIGVIPVYPGNTFFKKSYITTAVLQKWLGQLLEVYSFNDFLPIEIINEFGLPGRTSAYNMLHFPEQMNDALRARQQLKFEELFLFQLAIHYLKLRRAKNTSSIRIIRPGKLTKSFFKEVLPFSLTGGQVSALSDIKKDLLSGLQLNRLLQGDVGSGKTVVAIGAILMIIDNGYQAAFMAPTEILAEQHYRTLQKYLSPLGIDIRLLTGKRTSKQKKEINKQISSGSTQLVIGTHAIIQGSVQFHKLGLIVIDEQHRFGVEQRAHFSEQEIPPHMLSMSATPIPRSLAMSVFGKLDISVIKGLPAGRKTIKTAVRYDNKRQDVYGFLGDVLRSGGQAYIVYPLVEESEAMDLKDAVEGHQQISQLYPQYEVGLLHGKMKSEEKDRAMQRFADGYTQILVSTTVIEVGINVPNASILIVEHAERFGLSQLHQLRGRIGRGSRESFCILMAEHKQTKVARERLKTMVSTNDGFIIAEADLRLRGPGDFLGTRQSGLPDFQYADIIEDESLLIAASASAEKILREDPEMDSPKHNNLNSEFRRYLKQKQSYFEMM